MKLTLEADYAIRIVFELMRCGSTLSARKIAEKTGVTVRFTLKILRKLAMCGIVGSTKGASGGYFLALPPTDIALGQVVECIDGELNISHCLSGGHSCSRENDNGVCRFQRTFSDISAKLRAEFYAVKMSDYLDT